MHILDLVSNNHHSPAALAPEKQYALDKGPVGTQSCLWCLERRKMHASCRKLNYVSSVIA
jgi:hypothetical protein